MRCGGPCFRGQPGPAGHLRTPWRDTRRAHPARNLDAHRLPIYDRHALIAGLPVPHSPTDVDSQQDAAEAVTDARAAVAALVAAPDALKTLLDAGLPELLHAAAQWDPAANHATDHDRETAAVQLAQRLARFGEAVQLYYSPNRGNSRYEGYRLKKRSIAVPGRASCRPATPVTPRGARKPTSRPSSIRWPATMTCPASRSLA